MHDRRVAITHVGLLVLGMLCASLLATDAATLWERTHFDTLAILRAPHDAGLRFEIGNYYFGDGAYDLEKAQTYFKKAIDLDPKLAGAHYQLARVYFIHSDFYDALREINTEINLHPDNKRSYYVRGLINGYSEHLGEAENDFLEFLKWKPDSWAGYNDLAWVLFRQGKYEKSADAAQKGLTIAPDNPWLLNSLGVSLLNLKDTAEARAAFEKALTIVNSMAPEVWGRAYPGNDPRVYGEGLSQMKLSIEQNLALLDSVDSPKKGSSE